MIQGKMVDMEVATIACMIKSPVSCVPPMSHMAQVILLSVPLLLGFLGLCSFKIYDSPISNAQRTMRSDSGISP